ncbi:MAG: HAMP domain-containing protein [Rhodocyclaceae bacterium]|nr:HAMP domain-containing protein [Rhodocyclaceae bacterium]
MGRLFWKLFVAFWLSLVLAAVGVGVAVWIYKQVDLDDTDGGGRRGGFVLQSFASVLRHGGPGAAGAMLDEWDARGPRTRVFVLDRGGHELRGRTVPDVGEARAHGMTRDSVAVTTVEGAEYDVVTISPPRDARRRGGRGGPEPWLPLLSGLFASLAFSGVMAWYLARPVQKLRSAFGSMADGRLDTRVAARMGTWRDEFIDLGQDFDHMANRLQALVTAQRRLLHDVSHELRSPLARLQAAIGLARQNPARGVELMERVEREAGRLDRLVGELLTLARLDSGASDARLEALDLFDLAAGVAQDAAFEADVSGRSLDFQGEGLAPLTADGARLQRAFENVLRNAVKFSPPGGRVEVAARVAGGEFELTVADRGPGVPEGELESIFEPFFRSAGASAEGFGLGLAIAHRAVAAHGGRVSAVNRPQGGLRVTIRIPLAIRTGGHD